MNDLKQIVRRFTSMLLAILMALTLVPQSALSVLAATNGDLSGLSDPDIALSYSGSADNAWTVTSSSITGSVVKGRGCGASNKDSTLTILNKKSSKATLKFGYSISLNSGTIQIDGKSVSSNGTFSKEIDAGASIKIYLKSGSTNATTITLNNVQLLVDTQVKTTFEMPENGSYTVDGTKIESNTEKTQSSLVAYNVAATPNNGYQFIGWYNETTQKYISTNASDSLFISSDSVINAKFAPADAAVFETDGQVFEDLGKAVTYAQTNNETKITLQTSGTISGQYRIPAGITLLIPFDNTKTLYTTTPKALDSGEASTKKNEFRKLTLADGASITVDGAISVGGQYASALGSTPGKMTGNYGQIQLNGNSNITVNNQGNLYAWGFISGPGSVNVESGGNVYEWFQIADFRGGSATLGMANKVFPFSQYFIENIESSLTINKGAKEVVYSGIYASSSTYATSINLIGDDGMFKIDSGSLTKVYDGSTDRMIYAINGTSELNSLKLSMMGMSIDSSKYVLPITNNMSINISSGSKMIVNQDVSLLPGVSVNIAKDADMTVSSGKKMYVYDSSEWDKYACNQKFYSVGYAPSKAYTRSDNDLTDAKIDINGTLTASGEIYTTNSGADIESSEGTGKYFQTGAVGTDKVTHQYTQSGSNVTDHEIAITPAKLQNADGTYTETATAKPGDTIDYANGKWGGKPTYTVTWTNDDGTVLEKDENVENGTEPTYNETTPVKQGDAQYSYTFAGWTPEISPVSADVTYKATYSQTTNQYTITWKNADGTVLKTEKLDYGATPSYPGDTPIKQGDAKHSYTFSGWKAIDADGNESDITTVTGDATYTATYTESINSYTVTWLNDDGTQLQKDDNVTYGTIPEYKGETPSKAADAQYTYTFDGWTPAVNKVTGDITYTATYKKQLNQYTITWKNADGTVLKTEKLNYGTTPSYSGENPIKEGSAQYSYTFKGWSPEITSVTKDTEYTAEFEKTVNKYTVKWLNSDGSVLEKDENVEYGTTPEYNGSTPIKANDEYFKYAFDGWTPEVSEVTGNVSYTAKFKAKSLYTYTVTFDANGGNGQMDVQKFSSGIDASLTKNTFTRDNYKFTGWNTAADGSGVSYDDEAAVGKELSSNITLYAQWKFMNGWLADENGSRFYKDGEPQKTGWTTIEKGIYYLDPTTGYSAVNGIYWLPLRQEADKDSADENNSDAIAQGYNENAYYLFDSDGQLMSQTNGLFFVKKDTHVSWRKTKYADPVITNDRYIWVVNGVIYRHPGLVKVDSAIGEKSESSYYYFPSQYFELGKGYVSSTSDYFVSRTNGYVKAGKYAFGEDGKMILPDSKYTGLKEENGSLYYYKDGVRVHAGLIQVNDQYYYIKSNGEAAVGRYYVSNANNLLPIGWYEFGTDGKLIKDGLIKDPEGNYFYYQNGVKTHAGLIEIENAYYYIRSNGQAAVGNYYVSNTNGLLPVGCYEFGTDGKMLDTSPSTPEKNGLVNENNKLFYYKDGKKIHAGLVEIEGDYYYIKTNGEAATGNYYVSNTNDLMPVGWYMFSENGKMITK